MRPLVFTPLWKGLGAGSEISLITSNGTIESWLAVTHSLLERRLRARIHTSHAAVRILAGDPTASMYANSSLVLNVSTSEAPVAVYLHPAYEGTYDLQTTEARAEVDRDYSAEDPSEMNRQRTVHWTATEPHDRVWGHMYWSFNGEPSPEGMNRGSISIRSTKSDVTLYC
ncbi:hypothetical protein MVEN_01051300 [Mycena venus]|uniref:Uncharacterized protein n=1 Tax=Mycena venus TaxID=2733690 RepID=A0A8H7CX08_9AGAR|nr:hypothetical protein MVEN_01051300 [Mycena venus]